MDVRNWSLDKIMQLPDWCFGRRWWIGTYIGTSGIVRTYFTIEDRLPDRFVMWQILVSGSKWTAATGIRLALRLASAGENTDGFWLSPRLFHQIAAEAMSSELFLNARGDFNLQNCRTVHESRGLRICGAFQFVDETATCENMIGFLISAVPKQVPDWVVAGPAGN